MHGLDVCLERAELESIIESRPGGPELLRSDARLMRLLGGGRRYEITSDNGKVLYIVKYKTSHLEEMKRVINYAELDLKKLSGERIENAIMRSFTMHENDQFCHVNQRFLSDDSFTYLKDGIGLELGDKAAFDSDLDELKEHTHQLAKILEGRRALEIINPDDYDDPYEDIEIDCLKLIHRFLEDSAPPIAEVAVAIPSLVKICGGPRHIDRELESATSLKLILDRGAEEQTRAVVDAGAISLFSSLLESSNIPVIDVAVHSLTIIVTRGTAGHVKAVVMAGDGTAITKLTAMLCSEQEELLRGFLLPHQKLTRHGCVHHCPVTSPGLLSRMTDQRCSAIA